LDKRLTFELHKNEMLEKVNAKEAALWGLTCFIPIEVAANCIRPTSYCTLNIAVLSFLVLGNALIGNWSPPTITTKKYDKGSSTLSNMGNTAVYETVLNMAYVTVYFGTKAIWTVTCFGMELNNFKLFKVRNTRAIILETAVVWTLILKYDTLFRHDSYSYIISHIWNELPSDIKNSKSLTEFCTLISKIDVTDRSNLGCKCARCI
jgi:hypothetical protein